MAASALPAQARERPDATPAAGYSVTSFAAVGAESKPDDISRLGNHVYVAFQNGVGPLGEASSTGATSSTIQEYQLDGRAGTSWQVLGKVDGLAADEHNQRLLLTTNEDGNSTFSTLTPRDTTALKRYTYAGLSHGGGTDAISLSHGRILVSASAPASGSAAAVYTVNLNGNTAKLTPGFTTDAPATAVNGPQSVRSVTLGLTDPDSNTVVPRSAPHFTGDFMLTAQGDQQLIFADKLGSSKQTLQVLSVAQPLDDTAFAQRTGQTLWVTDPTHNTVDAITGPFRAGQAISAVNPTTGPAYLATLNLGDGSLTPLAEVANVQPKGLLFDSTTAERTAEDQ